MRIKTILRAPYKFLGLYSIDLALCAIAFCLATIFRFGFRTAILEPQSLAALLVAVPVFVAICAVVFPLSGLYHSNWRYASIADLVNVVRAVFVASITFIAFMFLFTRLEAIPRSVVPIEALLLVALLTAVRLQSRLDELRNIAWKKTRFRNEELVPILLVGAGNSADIYLRALQRDPNSSYLPVGFIDDTPDQQGLTIRGVPVLGTLDDFENVLLDLQAQGQRPRHIIFTESPISFSNHTAEQLIDRAERLGIAISRLSPATLLSDPRHDNRFELRPIELTDLLERPQAALDRPAMSRLIAGRRVLITGAGGSIGSELTRQIASLGPSEIVLIENTEFNLYEIDLDLSEKFPGVRRRPYLCNVREAARVVEIFERHKPELVFHAAALKHVPMVEHNPCEGILTNAIGTMNVAEAAKRSGALAMVQISTDKVVNTTNVMGATKRLAELYCQALDICGSQQDGTQRFMTVRFGNVLGSSGSLIPLFKRQLSHGGPLTVTDPEMTRFFMTIREAVELTLQASAYGLEKHLGKGEIFVLDMGEPIKIIDIARRMIRLAGYKPDEEIQIKMIGCRPGEKLYEELFDLAEERVDSPVPGVLGAIPKAVPLPVLRNVFSRLRHHAESGDTSGLFDTLHELLPTYRPQKLSSDKSLAASVS